MASRAMKEGCYFTSHSDLSMAFDPGMEMPARKPRVRKACTECSADRTKCSKQETKTVCKRCEDRGLDCNLDIDAGGIFRNYTAEDFESNKLGWSDRGAETDLESTTIRRDELSARSSSSDGGTDGDSDDKEEQKAEVQGIQEDSLADVIPDGTHSLQTREDHTVQAGFDSHIALDYVDEEVEELRKSQSAQYHELEVRVLQLEKRMHNGEQRSTAMEHRINWLEFLMSATPLES